MITFITDNKSLKNIKYHKEVSNIICCSGFKSKIRLKKRKKITDLRLNINVSIAKALFLFFQNKISLK